MARCSLGPRERFDPSRLFERSDELAHHPLAPGELMLERRDRLRALAEKSLELREIAPLRLGVLRELSVEDRRASLCALGARRKRGHPLGVDARHRRLRPEQLEIGGERGDLRLAMLENIFRFGGAVLQDPDRVLRHTQRLLEKRDPLACLREIGTPADHSEVHLGARSRLLLVVELFRKPGGALALALQLLFQTTQLVRQALGPYVVVAGAGLGVLQLVGALEKGDLELPLSARTLRFGGEARDEGALFVELRLGELGAEHRPREVRLDGARGLVRCVRGTLLV